MKEVWIPGLKVKIYNNKKLSHGLPFRIIFNYFQWLRILEVNININFKYCYSFLGNQSDINFGYSGNQSQVNSMYNRESQVGNMFNRERKIPSLFEVRPSMNSQEKIHVKLFWIFTIHLTYYSVEQWKLYFVKLI